MRECTKNNVKYTVGSLELKSFENKEFDGIIINEIEPLNYQAHRQDYRQLTDPCGKYIKKSFGPGEVVRFKFVGLTTTVHPKEFNFDEGFKQRYRRFYM
jgi:hypothetical protein